MGRWGRRWIGGSLLAAAILFSLPVASDAVTVHTLGVVSLQPIGRETTHGAAALRVSRIDSEVVLRMLKLPAPRPRGKAYVVWLQSGGRGAWIGGAFETSAPHLSLGLDTVVPGTKRTARSHLVDTRRIVLTLMSVRRLENIDRAMRRHGWRNESPIRGRRVAAGNVRPCERIGNGDLCPSIPGTRL
jgi:hypothetical protein